jgi:hypothetical protein
LLVTDAGMTNMQLICSALILTLCATFIEASPIKRLESNAVAPHVSIPKKETISAAAKRGQIVLPIVRTEHARAP